MKFIYKKSFSILVIFCLFICPKLSEADLFPTPPVAKDVAIVTHSTTVEEEKYKNKKWGFNLKHYYSIEQHKRITGPEGVRVIITEESIDKDFGVFTLTMEFKEVNGRLRQTKYLKEITRFSGIKVYSYELNFEEMEGRYPVDTYTSEIVSFLLKGIRTLPKERFRFHWWDR